MVVIIDYGVGNLTSVKNMLKRCQIEAIISSDISEIRKASKFILPGVGSFDHGIRNLKEAVYFSVFEEMVRLRKVPILGVCLGAQLLTETSEEGELQGLGWIRGKVVKFDNSLVAKDGLKIPHMGWSDVSLKRNSLLFQGMPSDPRFYFVHSYHIVCSNSENEIVTAKYGYEFTAAIESENIMGVQFHPEKSHKYGMHLYENFAKYY